jgi:hypothetical protein
VAPEAGGGEGSGDEELDWDFDDGRGAGGERMTNQFAAMINVSGGV